MELPVIFSAPGKVILHGEHAVVYGKAAMATSLDVRTYVLMDRLSNDGISLELVDLQFHHSWNMAELERFLEVYRPLHTSGQPTATDKEIQEQLREHVLRTTGVEVGTVLGDLKALAAHSFLHLLLAICGDLVKTCGGLHFTMTSQLPMGAGLGSSAAFAVSFAGAMLSATGKLMSTIKPNSSTQEIPELLKTKLPVVNCTAQSLTSFSDWSNDDLDLINKWSFTVEQIIHGTPSGIDNSISCHGGTIMLKSKQMQHLEKLARLDILLINTKVPRSSKKLIAAVKEKHDKYPEVMRNVLEAIDGITLHSLDLLQKLLPYQQAGDVGGTVDDTYDQLEEMVSMNHQLLDLIGVGHQSLTQVCRICRSHELNCKLTGSGGGGCAFAIIRPGYPQEKLTKLKAELEQAGFSSFKTSIGTAGVTQHFLTTNNVSHQS